MKEITENHYALRAFMQTALSYLGKWYVWGGDDPSGIDCSGLAISCLKAAGKLPKGFDATADGLYHYFSGKVCSVPSEGCLVFYYNSEGKIIHVMICTDPFFAIGAESGGKRVKTIEDAIKYNAFVKLRRIDRRSQSRRYVNVF